MNKVLSAALLPFLTIALPIMCTMVASVWAMISTNNGRLDDMVSNNNRRLDDIAARLGRIEDRLLSLESKVGSLELRAWH